MRTLSEISNNKVYQLWVRQTKLSTDYHNLEYLVEYSERFLKNR